MIVLVVTACPGGMVSTYLAGYALERAVKRRGWSAVVESQGNARPFEPLDSLSIEAAELVLVAADIDVDLTRFVGRKVFCCALADALSDPDALLERAEKDARVLDKASAIVASASAGSQNPTGSTKKIVAVTACPTGVAHTFMAAEALNTAARDLGYSIRVETRGSVGARGELTDDEIAQADVVVLACDIEVDSSRFAGKRVWRTSTGTALKHAKVTLGDALDKAEIMEGSAQSRPSPASGKAAGSARWRGVYGHLLTGVSFMLPMVVAGGLLIALSFVFGIEAFKQPGTLAAALMEIGGGTAFKLMVPILSGYIAYSIADRPGIAPGMIGGYLAVTLNAGFLGGILAGFLAGYLALGIARYLRLPQSMEALKPILVIPFFASLITGLTMIYVIGGPVAIFMQGLNHFLRNMGTGNAVLLGVVLGAMQCFDLGGPVNKAAYAFGVSMLTEPGGVGYPIMAAVMAAGMVPPLGMCIATLIARNKFSVPEREAGRAAFVLGLCFISEGAIPFMARDPVRVIPVSMIGGAVTGALSMLFGCQLKAPHGGLFVLLIPGAVARVAAYLVSIAFGAVVIGVGYAFVKPRSKAEDLSIPGTVALSR